MDELVQISKAELESLREKAEKYDKIVGAGAKGGNKARENSTPDERRERARKAAAARWAKKS